MAAGLHRGPPPPTIEGIYAFCTGLSRPQAEEVAAKARSFVAYVRSTDDGTADAIGSLLEHASRVRLKMP